MKILLLGANGQLGWQLQRALATLGELKICDKNAINLEDFDSIKNQVRGYRPDIIVNAAAYTAVDRAEAEPETAHRINAEAVKILAEETKHLGAWLIHYSTDYVFDGSKAGAYVETDPAKPINAYGESKFKGEQYIAQSGCKHLVFRTSWVYALRGRNFPRTILGLAREREELTVVADQFGSPTSAELIADITGLSLHRIMRESTLANEFSGVYHLAPTGRTSWLEFTRELIIQAGRCGMTLRTDVEHVHPVSGEEYPSAAKRPGNSQLNAEKLAKTFGVYLPPWQYHVKRFVIELAAQEAS
jgi:dTDP-4-dehydrorhamnose reductase